VTARVLIIAGSDSSGGAGIQADIKTVTMLGGHAMTAITAITAQNTLGVQSVHPVPTASVIAQIDSVVSDIGVDAIKIGMLGSAETAHAVADRLAQADLVNVPVVFDPVMVSTSGAVLADAATVAAFAALASRAAVVTPNVAELAALGGEAALLAQGCSVLAKGGAEAGETVIDRLLEPEAGEVLRWEAPRIVSEHTHGTGCTLASGIAVSLAQGMPLEPAISRARDFVRLSLHNMPNLGKGFSPLGQQMVRNDGLFTGPAINHISVPTKDIAAAIAFYKQMGLTQIVDSQENSYARFEAANGITLSLQGGCAQSGGTTIYLESGALDAWVAYLARRGVRFDQMPKDEAWGWREAHLADPDGNRICLYQAAEYRRFPPWRLS
jgi:hydroxymethylpyrimidine/phosphomethylpyrimidine kinase